MTLEVDRAVAVRKYGRHGDHVAILYAKTGEGVLRRLHIGRAAKIHAQHLLAFVRLDTLHLDPAKLARDRNSPGEVQYLVERLLAAQLVNRRPAHLARDRDLRACRRNQDAVTGFNMYLRAAHPAQHQVVQIDFFHQGLAAIVLDRAVGSGLSRASGGDESAQWSGKRADVISAGSFNVADDECPHRTQFAQGNVDGDTAELPAKHSLDHLLRLA